MGGSSQRYGLARVHVGLWLATLMLGSAPVAGAASYYVSTNGNNTWSGLSTGAAWRTLSHAMTSVTHGDTVQLLPGTYTERIQISSAITLSGADLYTPTAPPWSRHVSRTILRPPDTTMPNGSVIDVATGGVQIANLTIDGDADGNGHADAKAAINCPWRPVSVRRCRLVNVGGYGVLYQGNYPAPSPGDTEDLRGHLEENCITNVVHTNAYEGTGLMCYKGAADCISNVLGWISGTNARSAIYMDQCYYTSNMAGGLRIEGNTIHACLVGIWANQHGDRRETLAVRGNDITAGLIGVRVCRARGKASITDNTIAVSGVSPSGLTPARGIWVYADFNPWDGVEATDHRIERCRVIGAAAPGDATAGLYFAYDNPLYPGANNGVRATVRSNHVARFDNGTRILSGATGVGIPHSPLVEVILHGNDIESNRTYAIFTSGATNVVDALNNWWGSYGDPFPPGNPVSTNVWTNAAPRGRYTVDTDGDGTRDYLDDNDDGDRDSDTDELFAGSDPADPASRFEIRRIAPRPGLGVEIRWPSLSGRLYLVYRSTNLLAGFPALPWIVQLANPPTNSWTDPTATNVPYVFYRVTVTN